MTARPPPEAWSRHDLGGGRQRGRRHHLHHRGPPPTLRRVGRPGLVGPAVDDEVDGLLTFRGNPTRSWYGAGPVPERPRGALELSRRERRVVRGVERRRREQDVVRHRAGPASRRCGSSDGRTWVAFGAYDKTIHFLDAETGEDLIPPFPTGDIIKGSVTIDPDGFPLLYSGSPRQLLPHLAIDRGEPDGAVEALGRRRQPDEVEQRLGRLAARDRRLPLRGRREQPVPRRQAQPRLRAPTARSRSPRSSSSTRPGWDDELLADVGDQRRLHRELARHLRQHRLLRQLRRPGAGLGHLGAGRGREPTRTFRFWTGDDTDAPSSSTTRACSTWRRSTSAAERPRRRGRPADEARPVASPTTRWCGRCATTTRVPAGMWATPALVDGMVIVVHRRRAAGRRRPGDRRGALGEAAARPHLAVAGGGRRRADPGRLQRRAARLRRLATPTSSRRSSGRSSSAAASSPPRRCGTADLRRHPRRPVLRHRRPVDPLTTVGLVPMEAGESCWSPQASPRSAHRL